MIGENFFRIFDIKRNIVANAPEVKAIEKEIKISEQATSKVDKDDQKEKRDYSECIGCPLKDSDHCSKCLRVQKLYV